MKETYLGIPYDVGCIVVFLVTYFVFVATSDVECEPLGCCSCLYMLLACVVACMWPALPILAAVALVIVLVHNLAEITGGKK